MTTFSRLSKKTRLLGSALGAALTASAASPAYAVAPGEPPAPTSNDSALDAPQLDSPPVPDQEKVREPQDYSGFLLGAGLVGAVPRGFLAADTVPFQELISGALLGDLTAGYHLDGSPSELNRVKRWLRSTEVQRYAWPGNVRELQNALRNMLLGLEPALGSDLVRGGACLKEDGLPERVRDRVASLREVEDWYIAEVLDHLGHNYTQAAVALELDRATVRRRARSVAKTVGGSTR